MNQRKIWLGFGMFAIGIVIVCFVLLFAEKINLQTADLGRHIKNGEVILTGTAEDVQAVLHTNYFAYSYPDFPFVNHHWGIGVIFYKIWLWFGYNGLSVFYIALAVSTVMLAFLFAYKRGGLAATMLVMCVLLPLLASRREVRPEIVTYFFSMLFLFVLWLQQQSIIKKYVLFILPILQLLWVNIHIGFFFGEVIIGLFFIAACCAPKAERSWKQIRFLGILLAVTFLTTCINPNTIQGALYPLSIFKNYEYTLYENQSVSFLESLGFYSLNFAVFKFALLFTWVLVAWYLIKTKKWRFLLEPLVVLTAMLSVLAFREIRHIIMFALFALPLVAFLFRELFTKISRKHISVAVTSLALLGIIIFTSNIVSARSMVFGIGLMQGADASSAFYKETGIKGPIFNNYDIGSYLDLVLPGKGNVFVDNRPEAYPPGFFTHEYINPQLYDNYWKQLEEKYHFTTIWFYRNDLTPWGQQFLNTRAQDPTWALIYIDNFSVIFVKQSQENNAIIEKYKIKLE